MKKLLFIIFITSLSFMGCSDSSENEVNNATILGKWYLVKEDSYEDTILVDSKNYKEIQGTACRDFTEFKSDGNVNGTSFHSDCSIEESVTATWELFNNSKTLRLTYSGDTNDGEILVLDEDNLVLKQDILLDSQILYLEREY